MTWYYKDGDQEVGPVSKTNLQELINAKKINGKTLIRNASMNKWITLTEAIKAQSQKQHEPLSQNDAAPPPPPPEAGEPQSMTTEAPEPSKQTIPFEFTGTGGQYFKIWIVNVLLSIITLGIYSAWAKVRRKQYFYGNTKVAGASFRYLANPVKILKGRLIVFGVFITFGLLSDLIPLLGVVMMIIIFFLTPWLVVRSLAFNARNSAWRNIRFNFTGTYGQAAKMYILYPIISVFTANLLYPYVHYRQKRFIVENSAYGTTLFQFHASGKDYYAIVLWFTLPLLAIGLILGILLAVVSQTFLGAYLIMASSVAPPLIFLFLYFFAFIYFSVKYTNLLYNSGALRSHRFSSTMRIKTYAWIIITNTFATAFTLGLFHPFAVVRAHRYKMQQLSLLAKGDLDQFVAAEQKETSALGDEVADFMDFDFGL